MLICPKRRDCEMKHANNQNAVKTEYGEVAELVDAIYIEKAYHFCDTNSKQHTWE